jgi:starch-binding outer membrane protein, SusD/RagB family
MKKIIYRLSIGIILSGLILFSISCSDEFFETPTGNRIDPAKHYAYIIDADISYFGCFRYLQDLMGNVILVDGLRSDLMDVTGNADKDMIDINNHTLSPSNQYLNPSVFYKVIINVNEVIPKLSGILEKDRDFDSTMLYAYTGALVTLRTWSYFMLAKLNGEVGFLEENFTVIDPSKPPQYLSKEAAIDKLIEDLLQYYDERDIYRFPIDHLALLGELYLENNDYDNAAFYLKKCLDGQGSVGYYIGTDYKDEKWKNIFINSNSQAKAVISSVPYSYRDGQPNTLELIMNYNYMVKPTSFLIDAYNSQVRLKDEPGDLYRGLGATYYYSADNTPFITKYNLESILLSADAIIYRDADIHLLLAEALNRSGQSDIALILLNHGMSQIKDRPSAYSKWSRNAGVRGRVSLQALDATTVESIEDLIIQERALELAFEGKRWFDLVRIASRRNDPAYLADKIAAKFDDPDKSNEIREKLMNPYNWYLPLKKISFE